MDAEHAVVGVFGKVGAWTFGRLADATRTLGGLDTPNPALFAVANLFAAGAPRVLVFGLASDEPEAVQRALIGAAEAGCTTAFSIAAGDGQTPLPTWIDGGDSATHAALVSRGYIPVLPGVISHPPGASRGHRVSGASVAPAAAVAAPNPVPGAHTLAERLSPTARDEAIRRGFAVLVPAPGRRVAVTLRVRDSLAHLLGPRAAANTEIRQSDPVTDGIRAELDAILAEERASGIDGMDKRLLRRWTAVLERWRRRGALAGATSGEAFQVRCVAPGEFEVALRFPARKPTSMTLNSHIGGR
jgi:hypothetical protein